MSSSYFFRRKVLSQHISKVSSVRASHVTALGLMPIIFYHQELLPDEKKRFHQIPFMCFRGGAFLFDLGPYFGRDDVTDDVIIESSECLGKFCKCISVTYPQGFGQIFRFFAVRTKYVHLMTKYTPPP